MEKKLCIKNYTAASVTAVTYLPPKREVVAGFEDGMVKCWEIESGRPTTSNHKHKGWVSQLFYWAEGKVLFSASLDSTIVQWTSSFEPFYSIELGGPIYSMVWSPRKDQLICGRNGCVALVSFTGKMSSNGLPLLSRSEHIIEGHTDIVKCVAGSGSKAYSGGFDCKLFVYEVVTLPGAAPLRPITVNHHAHDAGITCMLVSTDADSNTWLATGSFDQRVKIWTAEGHIMLSVSCQYTVTGISYVPPTKVLWVAAGRNLPIFLEPKIGAKVSSVVPVLNEQEQDRLDRSKAVHTITYFPEISEVIGFTNHKEIVSWKYSTTCSVCIQQSPSGAHIEAIAFTNKSPALVFTASYDGVMTKWERHQLNPFLYMHEALSYKETLISHLYSEESEWNMLETVGKRLGQQSNKDRLVITDEDKAKCRQELLKEEYRGFVRAVYVEALDYLLASALDGRIFVWGYDESNIHMLIQMQKIELDPNAPDIEDLNNVTSRVAGISCLHVLNGHSAAVSGMAVVEQKSAAIYLVSSGWDDYLCVWDLSDMSLISRSKHNEPASPAAGETIIMDIDYSDKCDTVAYCTSDSGLFLCPFTSKRSGLKVKATLKGHTGEVTQVRWNKFINKWVSGSEDGTIRIWPEDGKGGSEMLVSAGGPVNVLTIDSNYGLVIAAVSNVIKLYDKELGLMRVSYGHTDTIQSIVHVSELNLYFSASWDKTMRIWKAYHPRQH